MPVGAHIQAWRISKRRTVDDLAQEVRVLPSVLQDIESELADPPASTLESLAAALNIPVSWLFFDPSAFEHLFQDVDTGETTIPTSPDPVTDRILAASRVDRSLFVLLTTLIQSAEPKLLRAAEMSLRSLMKQTRRPTVPWQTRPSGHFEPPSD
ncbi:MAG TPA: helix-turn-helix transcriptional regulator [Nitrospira sp.]|nr:helix-turn-helix transcriptional regulator [Nitrospira sp.]